MFSWEGERTRVAVGYPQTQSGLQALWVQLTNWASAYTIHPNKTWLFILSFISTPLHFLSLMIFSLKLTHLVSLIFSSSLLRTWNTLMIFSLNLLRLDVRCSRFGFPWINCGLSSIPSLVLNWEVQLLICVWLCSGLRSTLWFFGPSLLFISLCL